MLLLSATPIQNSRDDLAAQLALFLGRLAWSLDAEALAAHVVRGSTTPVPTMPRVVGPHVIPLDADDDCVDRVLALPPPIPARDEATAAALLTFSLVHQWTSSRAALMTALERRVARAFALESALEAGRHPTRVELAAWTWAGDAVQLAFPEIVARQATRDEIPGTELLRTVRTYRHAVEALIAGLRAAPDPDDRRSEALRDIRRRHAGHRIIAFCHYAETVGALWKRLGRDPGVAALTAAAARVAGGRVNRESVLKQFDPATTHETIPAERIDLLIATDVLSEGLNLHEASVVVHLDQPWNPARLDQRVGRVRRLGSRHEVVTIYTIAPPAAAERLLRVSERLRDKLRVARRTVGVAGHIMPAMPMVSGSTADDARPLPEDRGVSESASEIRDRLRRWLIHSGKPGEPAAPAEDVLVAAVSSEVTGWIALVETTEGPLLVVDLGRGPDTSSSARLAAIVAVRSGACVTGEGEARSALRALDHWLERRRAADTVELPAATSSRSRRLALNRVARALSRAPRHRRALIAPLATVARSVATAPLPEGAERVLDSLVESDLPDEAWLRTIAAFGELHVRRAAPADTGARPAHVRAILLLTRQPD